MFIPEVTTWARQVGKGKRRLPGVPAFVFRCPLCEDQYDFARGNCTIVRTAPRSFSLRCRRCGLHFTMTWHQIAKAARRWHEISEWFPEAITERFEEMAAALPETRGRRKLKGDQ